MTVINVINHADEGIERNWNNRNNRLAQLGCLITKIILIMPISFKKNTREFLSKIVLCKWYIVNEVMKHGQSKDLQVSFPDKKGCKVIYGEGTYIFSGDTVILNINNITGLRTLA